MHEQRMIGEAAPSGRVTLFHVRREWTLMTCFVGTAGAEPMSATQSQIEAMSAAVLLQEVTAVNE